MRTSGGGLELSAVELSGARLRVTYASGQGRDAVHEPRLIRLGPREMFLEWPTAPAGLRAFRLEWADNPFSGGIFRAGCSVVERRAEGVVAAFADAPPPGFADWFEAVAASLRREPAEAGAADAAVRTSKLYTRATVVSAIGLLCGALAILLPLLIGDRAWVDLLAKALLILMVASIAGFALLRAMAGRAEIRALGESRG